MPQLSIITVTYNAEKYLERTIQSILAQTDQDFEYIIVDGKSTDTTLNIVQKYKNRINQLVSEPDKGLYDAMNKGQDLATGDFVWFMNAGDEINNIDVVENIKKAVKNNIDVLYGDAYFVENNGKIQGLRSEITPHKLPKQLFWKDMKLGMLVCHQSFIARKSIINTYLSNNLSADIDWEIECLKMSRKNQFLDFVVSKYLVGGLSNKQIKRSLIDRFKILRKHFGLFQTIISHLIILYRGLKLFAKKKGKYW